MAKRVSIINFKGGVGKTTLAFQLAAGLVRYHAPAKVLVMDMDHQSSLSIVCLGPQAWNAAVLADRTVNEVFKPFVGQSRPRKSAHGDRWSFCLTAGTLWPANQERP
jgi:chromosome partitioning protein